MFLILSPFLFKFIPDKERVWVCVQVHAFAQVSFHIYSHLCLPVSESVSLRSLYMDFCVSMPPRVCVPTYAALHLCTHVCFPYACTWMQVGMYVSEHTISICFYWHTCLWTCWWCVHKLAHVRTHNFVSKYLCESVISIWVGICTCHRS